MISKVFKSRYGMPRRRLFSFIILHDAFYKLSSWFYVTFFIPLPPNVSLLADYEHESICNWEELQMTCAIRVYVPLMCGNIKQHGENTGVVRKHTPLCAIQNIYPFLMLCSLYHAVQNLKFWVLTLFFSPQKFIFMQNKYVKIMDHTTDWNTLHPTFLYMWKT